MDEKRRKLIEALEAEAQRLAVQGQDTTEHDDAIQFLRTGIDSGREGELLQAVRDDFETTCRDYGV